MPPHFGCFAAFVEEGTHFVDSSRLRGTLFLSLFVAWPSRKRETRSILRCISRNRSTATLATHGRNFRDQRDRLGKATCRNELHTSVITSCVHKRRMAVPKSVLEAIRLGEWDYEPQWTGDESNFDCTNALPGSQSKLRVLAERLRQGLPLWHPDDRRDCEDLLEEGLQQSE